MKARPLDVVACIALAATAGLLALPDRAVALSRMGSAEITDHDGLPCFGLPAQMRRHLREPVQLHGIDVSEHTQGKPTSTWSFQHSGEVSTPLPAGSCILYGRVPAGATVPRPALPLQTGKMYEVFLDASRSGLIQGYIARFCLKSLPDGSTRAIPISYDKRDGWSAAACQP